MKGKVAARLAAVALLLAGVVILAYPSAERIAYEWRVATAVQRYTVSLQDREENHQDLEELYQAMVDYNRRLFDSGQEQLTDPFAYEQADFSLEAYGFAEEMIGYLSIPRLDLLLPVYLGADTGNMAKGAAHLSQTSLPVGGVDTNAVICAHRGMGSAVMFRDLPLLEAGDEVLLTNYRETLAYRVVETAVIEPYQIDRILIRPGEDMITLLTCHPYGYTSQRYVVYCRRA